MGTTWLRRSAMALAAWLPFFVLWFAAGMSFGVAPFRVVLVNAVLVSGGGAESVIE